MPWIHWYSAQTPPEDYTATCEGTPAFNGFYGDGIVDALAVVSRGGGWAGL